ncbi:MAG: CpXC domain-containing protein [Litorilinea sp.]
MSGIILPGQDRDPKNEGKIELPSGFSRKRPEPAQDTDAEGGKGVEGGGDAPTQADLADTLMPDVAAVEGAQPAPGQTAAGQPAGAQAPAGQTQRQPGSEFLFPPRGAQIQCPSCGNAYTVPVFTIIDLGMNPELKQPLLSGQINVASCQSCGAGGALGAPLMIHDPEHQFLGVYMPMEGAANDSERQRAIGELSKALMAKLPSEARRGYMLQPQQFMDWQRFVEKLWGFEGVTPEMLKRQRDQSQLLQSLMGLVNDAKAMDIAVQRSIGLIDRDFFTMLDQIILMARGQASQAEIQPIMQMRERLLETTEAGKTLKAQQDRVRAVLAKITPQTPRDEVLDILEEAWQGEDGEQIVGTIAMAAAGLFDYEMLVKLAERVEAAPDDEVRTRRTELRQFIMDIQEQIVARQQQSQASAGEEAQAFLQEVLQSSDPQAMMTENADAIDDTFLAMLAANIQHAEQNKATAAARRLRQIYEMAVAIVQENLPDNLRLLNQLLSAPDEAAVRQLLKENRDLLSREYLESLKALETDMRDNEQAELANRIKSLRAQIALMI